MTFLNFILWLAGLGAGLALCIVLYFPLNRAYLRTQSNFLATMGTVLIFAGGLFSLALIFLIGAVRINLGG